MRISMIDPSLWTLPYDQALATGLNGIGHDVTLFGRRPGPDDSNPPGVKLVEAFYRVTSSPPVAALPAKLRLGIKGIDHLWSMTSLTRRLRLEKPDVIHFQWLPLPVVDRRLLSLFRRIAPLVLTVHDTNPFNGDPSSRLQAAGYTACLAGFEELIVHTEQGRARLASRGLPPGHITVLPHGPMDGPSEHRRDDPMQGELTFVLFGKIKPYKGADVLIEAFARLAKPLRRQARLRIVGKAYMDLEPLHALVQMRGLADRVSIENRFVADDEISGLFAPGTVAAFPYREIDISGVLPQALAHARPILASRIGCFAEMITDGAEGHLAPVDDVAALSAAMAHFVEDRGFAASCSVNALLLSGSGMSWTEIARRTVSVYEDAIARSPATTGVAA